MQNGMMFGGEGPIMQGTWYNSYTGDAFTVRDSFFEDNQYTVLTTDGRYLRYDQLKNYVQSEMPLEELKKMKVNKKEVETIPDEVLSLIDDGSYDNMIIPEDVQLTKPKLGNIYKETSFDVSHTDANNGTLQPSVNYTIIDKALRNAELPKLNIMLKWDNYPAKQIEMLKDIMEISEEEIVNWYLENITLLEAMNEFKTAIKTKIRSNCGTTISDLDSSSNNINEPTKSKQRKSKK